MTIVINGRCVYCTKRILVHRVRDDRIEAYENLVYHESCERYERTLIEP